MSASTSLPNKVRVNRPRRPSLTVLEQAYARNSQRLVSLAERWISALSDAFGQVPKRTVDGWICIYNTTLQDTGVPKPTPMPWISQRNTFVQLNRIEERLSPFELRLPSWGRTI